MSAPWRARGAPLAVGALAALYGCGEGGYRPYDGGAWLERRPRIEWPAGPAAVVSNSLSDSLTVVDLAGPRVVGTYQLGLDPVGTDSPHHVVLDPAQHVAYVPLAYPPPTLVPGPHGTHGQSTLPGVLLRVSLDDLRVLARAPTDFNPGDVVLTGDGARLLVSHFELSRAVDLTRPLEERRGALRVYRASDLRMEGSLRPCVAPHGLAVQRDGARAFVACYGEDAVAVVDLRAPGFPVELVPVGAGASPEGTPQYGPYSVTLSPDEAELWVGNIEGARGSGRGRELRVLRTAALREGPRAMPLDAAAYFPGFSADGATVYAPTQAPDGLVAVDRAALTTRRRRSFTPEECKAPHQASVGPDGLVYLVCEGAYATPPYAPGALLVLDPTTLETRARVPLESYPDAVVFHPGASARRAPGDGGAP